MTKSISLFAFDAENGDCLLLINNETQFSILIDSGPKSSSVTERIFNNIRAIIGNKAIDLAIVTHNDDDHIGGFKRLLKKGLMIKSYIFNHHDVINKILVNSRNKKVSIRQDIELEKVIKDKVVSLELTTSGYFNSVNYDVFNITFRSPNKDRLEDYSKWLEKEKKKKKYKGI
ncbi:MBL fold metallo-hydrolase [Photobacterium angustum]|uniref:MBL fold metallo-hydrolase n=1 Tax=Photobacterium angustum TaxID=661 RepID=UPI0005E07832|nr:MBL fold metallo-hydrolase [Photobacterium angustum]KJG42739.1 hypothetical protein UA35_01805 [Photobacterium angustum]